MPLTKPVTALIFDWGDTVMRDYGLPGPMARWEKVDWVPGAETALKVLAQNYTCVIATNAGHSGTGEMIAALQRIDANKYFRYFFSSKELGYEKPDPRFFIAVTEKSGLKPERCVMTGNLYEKDIVGAKEAGMQTIFFNEKNIRGKYPKADVIISSMEQLLKVIPEKK